MTPIEKLLDDVKWKEIHHESPPNIPYATHEGVLYLGVFKFKVYQLSDGQRVIDEEDLKKFFGVEETGP